MVHELKTCQFLTFGKNPVYCLVLYLNNTRNIRIYFDERYLLTESRAGLPISEGIPPPPNFTLFLPSFFRYIFAFPFTEEDFATSTENRE